MACACQNRADSPIQQLHQQVTEDHNSLMTLQQRYQQSLKDDFMWCDSMLQYVPEEDVDKFFDILNIAQAYLSQFNQMLPVMQHDAEYSQQQLLNLQSDIDKHIINDSLATAYLADEQAVADTLHQRIIYFQDRLKQQDKVLQNLKKTIGKESSR